MPRKWIKAHFACIPYAAYPTCDKGPLHILDGIKIHIPRYKLVFLSFFNVEILSFSRRLAEKSSSNDFQVQV